MRRTFITATIIAGLLNFSPSVDAMQRSEISGTTCPKLGAKRAWEKSSFICKSIGKRKVWIKVAKDSATTTVVQTGSFRNPIPKGSPAKDALIEVVVLGSSWNVMEEICEANFFNDGCDPNYNSSYYKRGDPNSPIHWVRVDLEFRNISNRLVNIQNSYSYAVSVDGRIINPNWWKVKGLDSIDKLEFLPGSSARTVFYMDVPKSAGTANLLFILRPRGSADWKYFGTE